MPLKASLDWGLGGIFPKDVLTEGRIVLLQESDPQNKQITNSSKVLPIALLFQFIDSYEICNGF